MKKRMYTSKTDEHAVAAKLEADEAEKLKAEASEPIVMPDLNMVVALTVEERGTIQDHLQFVIQINEQIKQLHRRLVREKRDLQVSFANAVRRQMLEEGTDGPIPAIPMYIGSDGQMNIQIDNDNNASWIPGREPK